ncbi:MAG: hypothetical protein AB7K71_01755 [Polyangiaceae bacterium]
MTRSRFGVVALLTCLLGGFAVGSLVACTTSPGAVPPAPAATPGPTPRPGPSSSASKRDFAPLGYYEPPPPSASAEPSTPPASPYPPVGGKSAVSRGSSTIVHAETEAACKACSGSWGYHGISGQLGCVCGTSDGGKRCTRPSDCEAECIVLDRERFIGVRCGPQGCNGPELVGQCSTSVTDFGCHGHIVEMPYQGGVVREVHVICVD